ncbi:MAG: hypothetical protein V1816_04215 [Pseudomonadota bacterium]
MTARPEVENEADFILLQGGEMPEVAMHESLAHLEREGFRPTPEETRLLREAVTARYMEIIRRDLDPGNLACSIFRGPKRAGINLGRLLRFARAHGFAEADFLAETGRMLVEYLRVEDQAASAGRSYNTLGLERAEVEAFIRELGPFAAEGAVFLDRVCALPTLDFREAIAAAKDRKKRG